VLRHKASEHHLDSVKLQPLPISSSIRTSDVSPCSRARGSGQPIDAAYNRSTQNRYNQRGTATKDSFRIQRFFRESFFDCSSDEMVPSQSTITPQRAVVDADEMKCGLASRQKNLKRKWEERKSFPWTRSNNEFDICNRTSTNERMKDAEINCALSLPHSFTNNFDTLFDLAFG
jgi:hypothetical protein